MSGFEHGGGLGRVIVFGAFEDFQFREQNAAETVLRNHAFDGVFDEAFLLLCAEFFDGGVLFDAIPAGIAHIFLGGLLFAGHAHLFSIDDDNDKITGVKVRRVDGLVFSAQDIRDLHGQTAQDRAIGINHMPLALIQINFRQMRFHFKFQQRDVDFIKRAAKVNSPFQDFLAGWKRSLLANGLK